jgi:hypothetical protein
MPRFEATFSLDPGSATGPAKPVVQPRAKGDSTKLEFLAAQEVKHREKGWPFDAAKAEEQFETIDTNNDGVASGKEKKAYWDRVMQAK